MTFKLTRREFLITTGAVLTSCGSESEHSPPAGEGFGQVRLWASSGGLQVGRTGDTLQPLEVRVTDTSDRPVAGLTIAFQVLPAPPREPFGMSGGEATLSHETAVTNADGLATTTVTLGDRPGAIVVESRAVDDRLTQGRPTPARFHLWSYPHDQDGKRPICLLSFNDFHMHLEPWGPIWQPLGGLARLATLLLAIRAANDAAGVPTVIFNAGDDFENTLFQDEPGAFEALMKIWDRIGVDFWQVGNHEFHFGIPYLAEKILSVRDQFDDHDKGHPMVLTWGNVDPSTLFEHVADYAELFETDSDDPDNNRLFRRTALLETGGIQVGVIGAVTDAAVYTQVPGDPSFLRLLGAPSPDAQGLTFLDPDPRASTYIADAIDNLDSQGAHLIVVNSHAGLGFGDRVNIPPGKDEHIARHAVGSECGRPVDLILSGHSHIRLNHAIFLENPAGSHTGLVQALEGGAFVSRVDLMVDTDSSTVEWIDSGLVQVDDTIDEDPLTADEVDSLARALDARIPGRKEPISHCDTFLSSRERTISGMGQLINAAFLHALTPFAEEDVEFVSMVVPSTYRTDIHPGPVDADLAYQVLSMHKMDAVGTHNDTIATITFRPGRYDLSFLGLSRTFRNDITIVEYLIEVVHSVQDVLGFISPSASQELSLDLVQMGGVSYVLDATASSFSRVAEGSVLVGDVPVDPDKTYRLAGPHSIISTLAQFLSSFLLASDTQSGMGVDPVLIPDETTDQPFTDTGISLWESLVDFLSALGPSEGTIPESINAVTGRWFRTVQPDLTVNPMDIVLVPDEAFSGETIGITVTVRNLGETPVQSARIALYFETSPWDMTNMPDGFEHLQGLPDGYEGSRSKIGETTIEIGAYPATTEASFLWTIPEDTPSGFYPIEVRLSQITSQVVDEHTDNPYTEYSMFNNAGAQRVRLLTVL